VLGFVKRIAEAAVLLLMVIVVNFSLVHIAPGDPASVLAGEMGGGSEEFMQQVRQQYGLDRPFVVQLGKYIWGVLHGDLGQSFSFNQPVTSLIWSRVGATALLSLVALLGAIVLGTLLGTLAARRPRSLFSGAVSVVSLAGFAAPSFWIGMVLIILFVRNVELFPLGGFRDDLDPKTGFAAVVDIAHHMVLPGVTLGFVYLAQYARIARASMVEVLQTDYIRTARAKGAPERLVLAKHALRNGIIPVVTVAGLQFGALLSGAVLVENVFNWPGLGRLAVQSFLQRDTPVLLGILLCSASMVIVFNLLTDLSYRLIDPRIRTR
jgi:peptide/nickel transport system permease protein